MPSSICWFQPYMVETNMSRTRASERLDLRRQPENAGLPRDSAVTFACPKCDKRLVVADTVDGPEGRFVLEVDFLRSRVTIDHHLPEGPQVSGRHVVFNLSFDPSLIIA